MDNIKTQIQILRNNQPKYLKNLQKENIRNVFDTFLDYNSSDDEDFYEDENSLLALNKKNKLITKYTPHKLYNTYDDFEAGYEKDYYDQSFINTLRGEDTKVKKVYLRDLLKIEFGQTYFSSVDKILPQKAKIGKKTTNTYFNFNKKYEETQLEEFKFKSNSIPGNKNKIITASNDLEFNFKSLEEYMNNYLKYENTSNIIEIIDLDNQKYVFKKINFRDSSQGKKNLFGDVDIKDLVKRAECLTKQRYKDIYNTMIILLKFFTLLKRIHKKKQLEHGFKRKKIRNMNKKKEHILTKINNDITSFNNLDNFFYKTIDENKRLEKFEKNKFIVNEINEKIKQFEIMKKEQLHQKLKEKMQNLLFNEDDSADLNANNLNENEVVLGSINKDMSMNETFNEDENEKIKKNVVDNAKVRRKGIKTNVQLDNELRDFIPEFIPQYQTRYLNGLKNKISQQLHKKKSN